MPDMLDFVRKDKRKRNDLEDQQENFNTAQVPATAPENPMAPPVKKKRAAKGRQMSSPG